MGLFSSSKNLPARSSMLRAWNLSTQTLADTQKIMKTVRASLETKQIVNIRRVMLDLTASVGLAMKDGVPEKEALQKIEHSKDLIKKLGKILERLLQVEKIDKSRLGVVIERLNEIKNLLENKRYEPKRKNILMDE